MIIHCDHCARVYDDAGQWTICPHNPLDCGSKPENFCWWCDLRKPCVCDRPPKFPARPGA